ncbi:MAG TPA: UDP-N-acetylmuramate dehydrogenase [Polyangia bacterium]
MTTVPPVPGRDPFPLADDVPLAPLTTLELGGKARHLVRARDEGAVSDAVAWAAARGLPLVVLGGGSNVVVPDAGVDGVVLKIETRGVTWNEGGLVTAAAGEPWDELVAATVARGWAGLECLTGIPGLVGATPIQNVGAYGQEVGDVIREVRALERRTGRVVTLPAGACGFGYRDSRFRRHPDEHVVLGVTFELRPGGAPRIAYRELEDALVAQGLEGEARSPAIVARTVRALRARKSMVLDPADPNRRSVGSFFTNPIVDGAAFEALAARAVAAGVVTTAAEVPRFEAGEGRRKVPAAWLIERAGFTKSLRRGAVGISSAHALALVHHGGGTTAALLALAQEIQDGVRARFGVTLEREPIVLGAARPAAS